MKIDILTSNLGIQNILDFEGTSALPSAETLAASMLYEAGLEDLYAPKNYAQMIEDSLCPNTGDGHLLRPEVFSRTMSDCLEKMQGMDNPVIKDAVNLDLRPLQENKQLLQAYCGLMIGG